MKEKLAVNETPVITGEIEEAMNKLLDQEPQVREAYDRQVALIHMKQMFRSFRKSRGLTQAELAKRTGTTQSVISRLEGSNSDTMPNMETLVKIAHACGQNLVFGAIAMNHGQPAKVINKPELLVL